MNSYDLNGRTAVITGGAGGLGRGMARQFLDAGAHVELWDASAAGLADAARELAAPLGRLTTSHLDITDAAAVARAAEAWRGRRLDILVNNAGILGEVAPLHETTPDNFRRVIEVNLIGTYLVTRALSAIMLAQAPAPERGRIINMSSIQGKEGMPRAAAYSASKAALIALTKTLARETAEQGLIVTCVTPAAAETAMAKELTPARRAEIIGRIPMARFAGVEEVARLVLWLASPDCTFSTGAVFDLSGGRATY